MAGERQSGDQSPQSKRGEQEYEQEKEWQGVTPTPVFLRNEANGFWRPPRLYVIRLSVVAKREMSKNGLASFGFVRGVLALCGDASTAAEAFAKAGGGSRSRENRSKSESERMAGLAQGREDVTWALSNWMEQSIMDGECRWARVFETT